MKPTKLKWPHEIKSGDVIMIRPPQSKGTRWMLVDAVGNDAQPVWTGRWVFGDDAGEYVVRVIENGTYVTKDPRDAALDRGRLEALRRRQEST